MAAPLYIPSSASGSTINNPVSTTIKTTSYTIPAGRYAYVTGRFTANATSAANVTSITPNSLTINGATTLVNNSFRLNRPISSSSFTFPSAFNGTAYITFTDQSGFSGQALTLDGISIITLTANGTSSATVNIAGASVLTGGISSLLKIHAVSSGPSEISFWVPTGTVLAGTASSFQWEVSEYAV